MKARASPATDDAFERVRILVLAPTGRDADTTVDILCDAGFSCSACSTAEELCRGIEEGAGVAVVTAEALTLPAIRRIEATLAAQPRWSEVPIMIFVAPLDMDRAARSFEGLGPRAHVTLVDRPIHVKTLVSVTRTAVRSRLRQYEIRDLLNEQQKLLDNERASALRLSGLAEASLAIASALSLGEVLQMITDQAAKVIDADFAVIWLEVEENSQKRIIRAVSPRREHDIDDESQRALATIAEKIQSTVRVTGDTLRNLVRGRVFAGVKSVIAAPVQEREGTTLGVLLLAEKPDAKFSTDDEAVLTQLAQMASAAVQNARLYREAQDANRAKDDFLATLAHELRTPMTGILGWVQLLKADGAIDGDAAMAIQMIESSTRVQARLVEDLLDVSRIIAGKLRVELTPVELAPLVESVVETFRSRADESKVALDVTIEQRPLSVYGDETRLHQVIWNLLSNAIKFTPQGGRVHIELMCQDSNALIRVSDTGRGISPDFLPHVFERFRQADNTTTRSQSGLGLGLAIVHHLVELHGGEVTVESDGLDKGSAFMIKLPVVAVRLRPSEVAQLREKGDLPRLMDANVLVVDDDEETGKLVAAVLTELGADARAVSSVSAAVAALRSFAADVVVSDIAMPGEDGYALMRRLRHIQPETGRHIRTMALTAYGRPEDRSRILASGFEKYIQKPVEPVQLAHAIAELLRG
jgi:signal transduction histidine kinase